MFAASFFRKWFDAVPDAGAKLPKVMKSSPGRELPSSSPVKSILPGAEGGLPLQLQGLEQPALKLPIGEFRLPLHYLVPGVSEFSRYLSQLRA
ncbi:hypothetical protein CH063_00723 [Colletotrichum higginsianum]|uniref:Uncharacterized protein n=1 Tax=Colletotrichum higginsianum (strain IMI 349063) TaxID=759273 RepID=H1UVC0_COLHI|nr:hypothetical protein CH063_00723 [Colletotrichum higginsianum]